LLVYVAQRSCVELPFASLPLPHGASMMIASTSVPSLIGQSLATRLIECRIEQRVVLEVYSVNAQKFMRHAEGTLKAGEP